MSSCTSFFSGADVKKKIDAVADLGIERTRFRQLDLILRPGKKHKFYLSHTPIKYEASSEISRRLVFNGIAFQVGLPVETTLQWSAWRFGYEYDFLYMKRGFVGAMFEAKYTDVEINLTSLVAREYAKATAPVPAIGGIGRAYLAPNVAVTFEVTGIGLPSKIAEDVEASYIEYDLYGTFNINRYVGARVGFRTLDVHYKIDFDQGDFKLKTLLRRGGPVLTAVRGHSRTWTHTPRYLWSRLARLTSAGRNPADVVSRTPIAGLPAASDPDEVSGAAVEPRAAFGGVDET